MDASSVLSSHGISQEVGLTLEDFGYLCPALLNQIDGGACILHGDPPEHGKGGRKQLLCLFPSLNVSIN